MSGGLLFYKFIKYTLLYHFKGRINTDLFEVVCVVITLQLSLDAARVAFNEPREAFRQRIIEEEKQHQELLIAQQAALKAEQDKRSPSPKGGAKKPQSPVGKKKK